ncbi:acetylglutamate kinase [Ligilactobacillus ruminis]|uniref:Acetylglutamate kinase n=1 Tax=Ligilactobacillus ruminis TaxID=1623 RepID=A0A8B2Z8M6_9LACO|nr:acetylglutamate kinase [Ligilactobacillus ruminis]
MPVKGCRDYGQMGDSWDLPVKGCRGLRAKGRFLGFARKMQIPVTGKTVILEICP